MHEGHRSRMREKFLKNGGESFLPHEFLEMLLFYAIPRGNTNPIAHKLIEKFGSLSGVIAADYQALKSVDGVGDGAATLIKFVEAFNVACLQDSQRDTVRFDKISVAREFGAAMLGGYSEERFCALLLDNRLRKIDFVTLTRGTVNHVPFDLAELYRACLGKSVSAVILYHNHPSGLSVPSRDDVNLTYQIEAKLADVNLCLLEHFVVGGSSCTPILYATGSSMGNTAARGNVEKATLEDFYACH